MDVVYFNDDTVVTLFGVKGPSGSTGHLEIATCERCGALVGNHEVTKNLHESFHRGWWVGYHEEAEPDLQDEAVRLSVEREVLISQGVDEEDLAKPLFPDAEDKDET